MLLLSSPRCGHQMRASLLLFTAVLLFVVSVSASLPAHRRCPPPLDCTLQGRHQCQLGSSHCGSCLSTHHENKDGRCVPRSHHPNSKVTSFTDLDEEIDFLHSVIQKQEKPQKTKTLPKQSASLSLQSDNKVKQESQNQDRLSGEILRSTTVPPTPQPRVTGADGRAGPKAEPAPQDDGIIVILISLFVVVGTVAVILSTVCYFKLQKDSHLAGKVDYPAFKGPGAPAATVNGAPMGDNTLAHSAQMYHYQHQKQQMMSLGNHKHEQKAVDSEVTSDEEDLGGSFTVYECPGLAPTGEMEVKNPLFDDSNLNYQGNPK